MSPSINILDEESKAVLVCETDPESGKIAIRKFEVKDGIVGQEIFLYGVDRDNNPTSYVAQCTVNRASECVVDAPIFGEDQDCTTGPYVRAILNARDSTSDFTEYLWLAKDPTLIGGAGGGIDLEGPAGVADSDEYGGSDFADTDGHTEITISDASGGDMSDVGYTEPPQDSGDESDEIGSQEVSGGEHLVSGVGGSSGSDLGGSEITAVAGTPIIGGASGKAGCSLIAEDDRYSLSTHYPALSTCHPVLDAGSSLFILLLTILVVGRSIPAFSNSKQKVFNNKHR